MNLSKRMKLMRFGIVGTAVAALYIGSYVVLVAVGLTEFLANVSAVFIAVVFQYIAQTVWTFQNRIMIQSQAARFVFTIAVGLTISTAITTFIGPAFGWKEYFSATLVVIVSSLTNYVLFTFWVYRKSGSAQLK